MANKSGAGILGLADQALSSLTQFLAGVIIGRNCPKDDLGLFMLGLSIIFLLKGVQSAVISSSYTFYIHRLKGAAQKYYSGSALIHQFGLSLITIFIMLIMIPLLSLGIGPVEFVPVIWALVLTINFIMLHEFVRSLLFANMNFSVAFIVDLAVLVIEVTGLLVLAHYKLLSARGAYWIIGAATGIAGIAWLFHNRRRFSFQKSKIIDDLKLNISFGKWVLGTVLIYYISTQGYYWFLAGMKGVAETGAFAACQGVVNIANPFLLGIYNVLRPEASYSFANGGITALKKVINKARTVISIPMIIFLFAILIYGERLVRLIYGSKYSGMGLVVAILGLSLFVTAICYPFDFGIWAMEKPNINFWITLSAPIVVLVIGLWLVNKLGILGAALGLLAGNMIILILRFLAFSKLSNSFQKIRSHI